MKAALPPILRRMYRVRIEGLENFPAKGGVIVAANHSSFMDSIWIPLAVPRRVVYLAKAEYFDSWKTAWFFRALSMIPVDRHARHKAEAALNAGVGVLGHGGVLGVYPEGTRSVDGRVYRGRTGVGRLVLRSQSVVVPVGLSGSREVMPKGARFPKVRGRVTVRFGKPMDFSKFAGQLEDRFIAREVTDEIMFAVMALCGQEYVDRYSSIQVSDPPGGEFRLPTDEMLG